MPIARRVAKLHKRHRPAGDNLVTENLLAGRQIKRGAFQWLVARKEAYTSRTLLQTTGFDPHALHSIYVIQIPFAATYCNAFLHQTLEPKLEAFIAASIGFFSSGVSRTEKAGVRWRFFGTDGRPAFFLIK